MEASEEETLSKCGTSKVFWGNNGCGPAPHGNYALLVYRNVGPLPFPEIIPNGCFVETLALAKKLSDVIAGVLQQIILNEELNSLEE